MVHEKTHVSEPAAPALSSTDRLVDLVAEGVDLGIRYGFGRYPGLVTEKLADDAWVVVCSPAFAARTKLRSPRDLSRLVLLQDDAPDAWSRRPAVTRARSRARPGALHLRARHPSGLRPRRSRPIPSRELWPKRRKMR